MDLQQPFKLSETVALP